MDNQKLSERLSALAEKGDNSLDVLIEKETEAEAITAWNTRTTPLAAQGQFKLGDTVSKKKGSQWTGKVVGFYSTKLTPIGCAVESSTEKGSVQIYPETALEHAPSLAAQDGLDGHFPTGLRQRPMQLATTDEVFEGPVFCDCYCGESFAGSDEQEVRQLWAEHALSAIKEQQHD